MSVLLSILMVIGLLPTQVFAAPEQANYLLYYNTTDGLLHKNSIDGDVLESTAGMAYSGSGNTLTLKGFSFDTSLAGGEAVSAALVMPAGTSLILEGENSIQAATDMYGICGKGSLTIGGSGSLNVTGLFYGIYAGSDVLTINGGNISANAVGGDYPSTSIIAIYSGRNLTINDGTITATAGSCSTGNNSVGIGAFYDVRINGGITEAAGMTAALRSIDPRGVISIAAALQIKTGENKAGAAAAESYTGQKYVYAGAPAAPETAADYALYFDGADGKLYRATVAPNGNVTTGEEYAGQTDKWEARDTTLTLKGLEFETTASRALIMSAGTTLQLEEDTESSLTSTEVAGGGILGEGKFTITGTGTLKACGTYGIVTPDLVIENGTVYATGIGEYSVGLYGAAGEEGHSGVIKGGKVIASGSMYGIYGYGDNLRLEGGEIQATGNDDDYGALFVFNGT